MAVSPSSIAQQNLSIGSNSNNLSDNNTDSDAIGSTNGFFSNGSKSRISNNHNNKNECAKQRNGKKKNNGNCKNKSNNIEIEKTKNQTTTSLQSQSKNNSSPIAEDNSQNNIEFTNNLQLQNDNSLTLSSSPNNNSIDISSSSSSVKSTATTISTMPSTTYVNSQNHPSTNGTMPTNASEHSSQKSQNCVTLNNNNNDKNNGGFLNNNNNNNNNNLSNFHQNAFSGLDTAAAIAAAALSNNANDIPDSEDREPIFLEYSAETAPTTAASSPSKSPPHSSKPDSCSINPQSENGNYSSSSNGSTNSPQFHNSAQQQRLSDHRDEVLSSINAFRKQGQFCDVKLVVEEHEVSAHRAVLASTSPYLFDFLSCLEECEGQVSQAQTYRLKDVPYVGFQHLLDYMYTGRLHVPLCEVPLVYGTAIALRMDVPARACAHFLSSHLTEANCLVIRRFSRDEIFRAAVDEYIQTHLDGILNSKSFFGLNNLQIEIVGLDESIEDKKMEHRLFSLVLNWAKTRLNDLKPKMERLTEQVNVLYLNQDNTLLDCADMEDHVLSSDDDVVIDYKKMARRRSKTKANQNKTNGTSKHQPSTVVQAFHKFQLNPEEAVSVAEREWSIIATRKTSDNAYLSIAVLDGKLMAVSLHIRPPITTASSDGNVSGNDPDSPTSVGNSSGKGSTPPMLRKASIAPLECMSTARCAMGAVEIDGKIVVMGGYDRGECLQSVESFSLQENRWTSLPPMKAARGRFSAAAIDGFIYTCGGSDGWKELSCVERFELSTGEWKFVASMIKERSSHGVATLNGKLYCIGGSDGQRSIADCEVYDPKTNTWTCIASLNQSRIQTCVCAYQGMLYAIGGTDQWNTLNSVEVYDPEQNQWIMSSQLNITRRGAGVDIVDDMMIVVGGSDGMSSLTSTELYNAATLQWTIGPQMGTPRANLSAVTVGHRLFAIGGFSGKKFLSTAEWLDCDGGEWLGLAPKMIDLDASRSTGDEGEIDI